MTGIHFVTLLYLFLFIMSNEWRLTNEFQFESIEKNLTVTLLNRYQFYGILGRPVSTREELVNVQYGLQLIQILDLDENQQILRSNCWSMYRWRDKFLEWNPKEYNGITELRVFPDQIWTPDIKLYNFADTRLKEARIARVIVKYTGETLWVPQAIFKSTCSVEITYFPFDTQVCMLEFGSWTYDISQLDIQWWVPDGSNESTPFIDFADYLISPEWQTDGEIARKLAPELRHTQQIRSVKKIRTRSHHNAVTGDVVTRHYPVLRFLVKLRRNPDFYVSILVIPCVLLSSLTMVVFWLPPESPAKMMLGMNIFVAFFILLQLLNESTPSAVKLFPLIGAFFCLNMVMITLSTFLATFVINLYFKGHESGPLPRPIRRFLVEGLGRLLMVRQHIPLPPEPNLLRWCGKENHYPADKVCVPDLDHSTGNKFLTTTCSLIRPPLEEPLEEDVVYKDEFMLPPSPGFIPGLFVGAPDVSAMDVARFWGFADSGQTSMWRAQLQRQTTSVSGVLGRSLSRPLRRLTRQMSRPPQAVGAQADTQNSPLLMRCHTRLEQDVRELKRCLGEFAQRQRMQQRRNLISMEWRTLALVLDRLFFVLYVSSIFTAIVACYPTSSTVPEIPAKYRD